MDQESWSSWFPDFVPFSDCSTVQFREKEVAENIYSIIDSFIKLFQFVQATSSLRQDKDCDLMKKKILRCFTISQNLHSKHSWKIHPFHSIFITPLDYFPIQVSGSSLWPLQRSLLELFDVSSLNWRAIKWSWHFKLITELTQLNHH